MNVAVLMTGGVRNFNEVYPTFQKRILSVNPEVNFDIYISTWETAGMVKKGKDYKVENTADALWIDTKKPADITKVMQMINPAAIKVENFIKWRGRYESIIKDFADKYSLSEYSRINSAFTQFYKLKDCLGLIPDPNKYDAMIKYRFDLKITEDLPLKEIEKEIEDGVVITDKSYSTFAAVPTPCIPDHFAIGNTKAMETYANTFNNIQDIGMRISGNYPLYTEAILTEQLRRHRVKIIKSPHIRNEILR